MSGEGGGLERTGCFSFAGPGMSPERSVAHTVYPNRELPRCAHRARSISRLLMRSPESGGTC
jgi:hypothetical protein